MTTLAIFTTSIFQLVLGRTRSPSMSYATNHIGDEEGIPICNISRNQAEISSHTSNKYV
jgi:hypothetical protein